MKTNVLILNDIHHNYFCHNVHRCRHNDNNLDFRHDKHMYFLNEYNIHYHPLLWMIGPNCAKGSFIFHPLS